MRIRKRLQLYFGLIKWYGQRKEDKIIAKYFRGFKGTLLSIGENDGRTYSNVLHFIKNGWEADLVEPSPIAFKRLFYRHLYKDKVWCHSVAIGEITGKSFLWESGSLVNLGDVGLVSTLKPNMCSQWTNTEFVKKMVHVFSFTDYHDIIAHYYYYDLISIDAEGMDYAILKQMDLQKLCCRCLIVEHGGDIKPFNDLVFKQGYRLLATTEENAIYCI